MAKKLQTSNAITALPEPWLAGRHANLHALARLLCCSLDQSLAELRQWMEPLSDSQIWRRHKGMESAGFQLRHLAGSVDRLLTYAKGRQLRPAQLDALREETSPEASREELFAALENSYRRARSFARATTAAQMEEPRFIGRRKLETTLGVLLGHIAEHTQRHTGQAILLAKLSARTAPRAPRPK